VCVCMRGYMRASAGGGGRVLGASEAKAICTYLNVKEVKTAGRMITINRETSQF
jgi:hypothetical protein